MGASSVPPSWRNSSCMWLGLGRVRARVKVRVRVRVNVRVGYYRVTVSHALD